MNSKCIKCLQGETMSYIIRQIAKMSIPKENIVQIVPFKEYIYLIYYE